MLTHIRPEAKALHYGRMVGHAHDSKTVWRIWDPEFQRVKAQSDDVFDNEEMHTCRVSMTAMRSTCLYYQKMRNMSSKQITERSLSEDQRVNLCTQVSDPYLKRMKLMTRKQKMPTSSTSAERITLSSVGRQNLRTPAAGSSTERIRLRSVWQQTQKTSPLAGDSAERIGLPGVEQQ